MKDLVSRFEALPRRSNEEIKENRYKMTHQ